jgi:hypothetical protein
MRASAATLVLFLLFHGVAIAGNDRPVGINCDLKVPPTLAGEEINHGFVLRIYPRAKDISASYTGCQVLFHPDGDKWVVVTLTEVIAGDPVRIWSADDDSEMAACRFKNGKLVAGNPEKCPMPRFLLLRSLAPGCFVQTRKAVETNGLGAPRPPECRQYE